MAKTKQMNLQQRVMQVLRKQKREPISLKKLASEAKVGSAEREEFRQLLDSMRADGSLLQKKHSIVLSKNLGLVQAEIVSVLQRFGFARPLAEPKEGEKPEDIYIPGRMMQGAMPGDTVLIKLGRSRAGEKGPEGSVVRILAEADREFTGVLQKKNGKNYVVPDKSVRIPMEVSNGYLNGAKDGDKVLAKLTVRGEGHFSHKARIIKVFGSAQYAQYCCEAILSTYSARTQFDEATLAEARKLADNAIPAKELTARMDLTGYDIFTIDSADSKDLDDAVSLEREGDKWFLGVHIADVSHYVKQNTAVDREAYARGTSVYYADQVLPMLPKELSNGICSLNPDEVRLTFSALITLDAAGNILGFKFVKSYIRSRVKGIYKEINAILDGSAGEEITKKYAQLIPEIKLMQELAHILTQKRFGRGAMNIESSESKFVIENGRVLDIVPRPSGESERMIEEFMLTANQAAATLAMNQELPFVYRVHDKPPASKLEILHTLLSQIGLDASKISSSPEPIELSNILEKVRGTELEQMVNNQLLRTMAKAIYSDRNIGHFGLVLENYAHFTSPIRRYPDLIIHRILSSYAGGASKESIVKRFAGYVPSAAKHCSDMELNAMSIERDCEDCYKAEYMSHYIGKFFDGVISSVMAFGLYIQLQNTVEGLVHVRNLPDGEYSLTESMELLERFSGTKYHIGQKVRVMVVAVDVSAGQVDFVLRDETDKDIQEFHGKIGGKL